MQDNINQHEHTQAQSNHSAQAGPDLTRPRPFILSSLVLPQSSSVDFQLRLCPSSISARMPHRGVSFSWQGTQSVSPWEKLHSSAGLGASSPQDSALMEMHCSHDSVSRKTWRKQVEAGHSTGVCDLVSVTAHREGGAGDG